MRGPLDGLGKTYDCVLGNERRVLDARWVPGSSDGFSVAIAHYNRSGRIHQPLLNLMGHPGVREVVIVDDGSRGEEYERLAEFVERLDGREFVKVHRREKNCGALISKMEAVERCESEWVLVLDSDNTAFWHYLDQLQAIPRRRDDTIYGAAWAFPFFPFHEFAGVSLDFTTACETARSGLLKKAYMINDGNYLVPRERYVRSAGRFAGLRSDVADVMLFNYLWLTEGGRLELIPGTSYFHRVDATSFWMQTKDASRARVLELFARMEGDLTCDEAYLTSLMSGPDDVQK